MGLLKTPLFCILKLLSREKASSICMIGKQDVHMTVTDLENISKAYNLDYDSSKLQPYYNCDVLDSTIVFEAFGYHDIHSLDFSNYEGADILFDLNENMLPDELENRFDFVINGGTLEHVFNVSNAMNNINRLVKPGGIVFHSAPCSGWIDHGFYSISPCFFLDYYAYNRDSFAVEDIYIQIKKQNGPRQGDVILSPDLRELDDVNLYMQAFSTNEASIVCIVKRKNTKGNLVVGNPIQGLYKHLSIE